MKRVFFLLLILTGALFVLSYCKEKIEVQDRKYYLLDFCNGIFNYSTDTVTEITSDNKYIEIKFNDENGSSWFRMRQRNSVRNFLNKIEGNYTANPIKYDTVINGTFFGKPGQVKEKIVYYKPLRAGIWNYYDSSGRLLKIEKYIQGKLVN